MIGTMSMAADIKMKSLQIKLKCKFPFLWALCMHRNKNIYSFVNYKTF